MLRIFHSFSLKTLMYTLCLLVNYIKLDVQHKKDQEQWDVLFIYSAKDDCNKALWASVNLSHCIRTP